MTDTSDVTETEQDRHFGEQGARLTYGSYLRVAELLDQQHLESDPPAHDELLFLKQGVVLSKDAFLTHLYCGREEPEMKTIDVIICRLRKKLAEAGVPTLIDTVWGCGYILRDPSSAPANATDRSDVQLRPLGLEQVQMPLAA